MKKFIAVFIGVALLLLCATPALAAGFSLSPAEVEFDVLADSSSTVEFLVYDFGGDLEVSLEDIPLRVEPEKVSVVASAEGTLVELTFYGDESLGSKVFKGKIVFIASSGGNVAFGVKVIATVNHIAGGEPLPEEAPLEESSPVAPEEETPQETSAPAEKAPTEESPEQVPTGESEQPSPTASRSFPVLPVAGIAGGTIIIITLIIVLVRRSRY